MSEARVAAVVCEGQTDFPIFSALIQEVWPEVESVRCLQPELDEMDRARPPGGGWTQVKAWCERRAGKLDEILDPDLGDPIDLLVIAIDVDVAIEAGIADPPQRVGAYETDRLRLAMAAWLKTAQITNLPVAVVFSTPVTAVEAWVVAALFPREKSPELIHDPAKWLVQKKKLRTGQDGKPWKELHLYKGFAPVVAKKAKRVREVCKEAERTLHAVEHVRRNIHSPG